MSWLRGRRRRCGRKKKSERGKGEKNSPFSLPFSFSPNHPPNNNKTGKPPGNLNSNGSELLVYGKRFGNVFIGVQPTFGYEGDPMRLLFSRSASPHHGFAAFYTYVEKVFGADAVLHFGTHGSLEFMPGKQVGMSGG